MNQLLLLKCESKSGNCFVLNELNKKLLQQSHRTGRSLSTVWCFCPSCVFRELGHRGTSFFGLVVAGRHLGSNPSITPNVQLSLTPSVSKLFFFHFLKKCFFTTSCHNLGKHLNFRTSWFWFPRESPPPIRAHWVTILFIHVPVKLNRQKNK